MTTTKPTKMPCRILYRRCTFPGPPIPGRSLQSLISQALAKTEGGRSFTASWKLRLRDTSDSSGPGAFSFMNHLRGHAPGQSNNIFGDLCHYQAGSQQAIIDQVDEAPELAVTLLSAKDRQQFLDGMFWWRVSGNHVLAVQGKTARWKSFESYLKWLLIERTNILSPDTPLSLTPQLKTDKAKMANASVRSLKLSSAIPKYLAVEPTDTENTAPVVAFEDRETLGFTATSGGSLWKALQTIMPGDEGLKNLMARLPDGEDLNLEVLIRFPGKRAMPNQIKLSSLQDALDALQDADVEVETDQGPVRLSEMLQQPEHAARVLSHGGIWDREDLYRAFGEAWNVMVGQGIIAN